MSTLEEILPRVAELESWRKMTEARLASLDQLSASRHAENQAAIREVGAISKANQAHLSAQDEAGKLRDQKLDTVVDVTQKILQKIAHDDGTEEGRKEGEARLQKAHDDRVDEIRWEKMKNIAIGGIWATIFAGVICVVYYLGQVHAK